MQRKNDLEDFHPRPKKNTENLRWLKDAFKALNEQAAAYAKSVPTDNVKELRASAAELERLLAKQDNILSEIATIPVEDDESLRLKMDVWTELVKSESRSGNLNEKDKIIRSVYAYLGQRLD